MRAAPAKLEVSTAKPVFHMVQAQAVPITGVPKLNIKLRNDVSTIGLAKTPSTQEAFELAVREMEMRPVIEAARIDLERREHLSYADRYFKQQLEKDTEMLQLQKKLETEMTNPADNPAYADLSAQMKDRITHDRNFQINKMAQEQNNNKLADTLASAIGAKLPIPAATPPIAVLPPRPSTGVGPRSFLFAVDGRPKEFKDLNHQQQAEALSQITGQPTSAFFAMPKAALEATFKDAEAKRRVPKIVGLPAAGSPARTAQRRHSEKRGVSAGAETRTPEKPAAGAGAGPVSRILH